MIKLQELFGKQPPAVENRQTPTRSFRSHRQTGLPGPAEGPLRRPPRPRVNVCRMNGEMAVFAEVWRARRNHRSIRSAARRSVAREETGQRERT